MKKRLAILVALAVMTVTLAGCRPAPPTPPPTPWDDTVERQNVTEAVNAWVNGVEAYDIDAMAGESVLAAGFQLRIEEAGESYTKDADQLRAELAADEDAQKNFRSNENYIIELRYDSSIVEITPSVARVAGPFKTYESCVRVPRYESDHGQIVIELEKGSSAWKITAMTIKFEGGAATKSIGPKPISGFGFYKLVP